MKIRGLLFCLALLPLLCAADNKKPEKEYWLKPRFTVDAYLTGKIYSCGDRPHEIKNISNSLKVVSEKGATLGYGMALEKPMRPGFRYDFTFIQSKTKTTWTPDRIQLGETVIWEKPGSEEVYKINCSFRPAKETEAILWLVTKTTKPYLQMAGKTPLFVNIQERKPQSSKLPEYKTAALAGPAILHPPVLPELGKIDAATGREFPILGKTTCPDLPIIGTDIFENRFDPEVYRYFTDRGINAFYVMSWRDKNHYVYKEPDREFQQTIHQLSENGKLKALLIKNDPPNRDEYDRENQTKIAHFFKKHCPDTQLYYLTPEVTGDEMRDYFRLGIEEYPNPKLFKFLDDWTVKLRDWNAMLRREAPEGLGIVENTNMGLFPFSWCLHGDLAFFQNKTIKRQNVQLLMSNIRGHAKAFKTPCAMRLDAWYTGNRSAWWTGEMERAFLCFYYGGADYIDHESGEAFELGEDGKIQPNARGEALLSATSFIRNRPARGDLLAPIAVMRGRGSVAGRISMWRFGNFTPDMSPPLERYNRDLNLLDVFFPMFGNCYETDMHRLFTGTPYGNVDLVPFDASADFYKNYPLLIILGLNAMTDAQAKELIEYVRTGGTLIMPAGAALGEQIRTERKLTGGALFEAARVEMKTKDGVSVSHEAENGDLQYEISGCDTMKEYRIGKGTLVLINGETASTIGVDNTRAILRDYAEKAALIRSVPESTWLETFLMREEQGLSVGLFNHGRLPEGPAGNRDGAWSGEIRIKKGAYGGKPPAKPQARYAYPAELRGKVVPVAIHGDEIILRAAVDQHAEIRVR